MSVDGTVKDEIAVPPGGPARRKSRGEAHPLIVIALSFVTAIIVGGILIAVTNQPTRDALRHFSASPAFPSVSSRSPNSIHDRASHGFRAAARSSSMMDLAGSFSEVSTPSRKWHIAWSGVH